jgi:hypothetical protein
MVARLAEFEELLFHSSSLSGVDRHEHVYRRRDASAWRELRDRAVGPIVRHTSQEVAQTAPLRTISQHVDCRDRGGDKQDRDRYRVRRRPSRSLTMTPA